MNNDRNTEQKIAEANHRGYRLGYLDGYRDGAEDARQGLVSRYPESEAMYASVRYLNLSPRAYHALEQAGYSRIRDLITLSDRSISTLRGAGAKSLREIAEALRSFGIEHTAWDKYL